MKILLLGEFSSLHKNLQEGLVALGHEVTVASNGDGWKNISADIKLGVEGSGVVSKVLRRVQFLNFLNSIKGYDVVQIVNAEYFCQDLFPNELMLKRLKKRNGKVFLLGAGDDAFFWKYGKDKLKYGPFNDSLKYDFKSSTSMYECASKLAKNRTLVNLVDGVIPIMYEYQASYSHVSNLRNVIPIPINTDEITRNNIGENKRLTIFHGLNREGFKGTHYVKKAFEILKPKYPHIDFIIEGKMPLKEYLELMSKTDVIIDQVNSHSLGVNGLLAMAMGKVTLGGAEPESLKCFGIDDSPVINIKPCVNDIVDKLERVIATSAQDLNDLGLKSREYVCSLHDYKTVAEKYIKEWSL